MLMGHWYHSLVRGNLRLPSAKKNDRYPLFKVLLRLVRPLPMFCSVMPVLLL